MKKCPFCAASCEDSDVYCSGCGFRFDAAPQPEQPPRGAPSGYAPAPEAYGPRGPVPLPPAPPYGGYYLIVKNNAFAVASLVLGLTGIPLTCVYLVGCVPAVLAVIFGFVARSQINASPYTDKGMGLAIAGIILGFCSILLAVVLVILFASALFITTSAAGSVFSSSQYTPA